MLYSLCLFSNNCDIDLSKAFEKKIKQSEDKYPIEKAKGVNKKYTEL